MLTSDRSEQRFAPKDYRQEGDASQVAAYPAGGNAIKPDRDVDTLRPAGTILLSKGRQLLEYFEQRLLDILRNKLGDEGQAEDIFKTVRADPSFPSNQFNGASRERAELPEVAPELFSRRKDLGETPLEFIARVWGSYVQSGVASQEDIFERDRLLIREARSFCLTNGLRPKEHLPPTTEELAEEKARQLDEPVLQAAARIVGRQRTAASRRKASM